MKYLKPKSLTWWAGFVPLLAGLVVALSDVLPVLAPVRAVIDAMTGNAEPAVLVNAGLVAIGLRGAVA